VNLHLGGRGCRWATTHSMPTASVGMAPTDVGSRCRCHVSRLRGHVNASARHSVRSEQTGMQNAEQGTQNGEVNKTVLPSEFLVLSSRFRTNAEDTESISHPLNYGRCLSASQRVFHRACAGSGAGHRTDASVAGENSICRNAKCLGRISLSANRIVLDAPPGAK
jgi:hypothetical protein